jgi:EAL domain-containing protein (putative c-di-GMP-specific phosphodiesterase class I)
MEVVAEGVESDSEKAVLVELGCKEFQGYLFSKPLAPDLFLALFSADS